MIKLDYINRTIDIQQQHINSPEDVKAVIDIISAVMFYPEDLHTASNYIQGIMVLRFKKLDDSTRQRLLTDNPDLLQSIMRNSDLEKRVKQSWIKPHKGQPRFVKGCLAGQMADRLCPLAYNMSEIHKATENNPHLIHWATDREKPERQSRSRKSNEQIWNDYKHVSHLWWANNSVMRKKNISLLIDIPYSNEHDNIAKAVLKDFCREATFYHNLLIDKRDPTAGNLDKKNNRDFQIQISEKMWSLLEDTKPFTIPSPAGYGGSISINEALTRLVPFDKTKDNGEGPLLYIPPSGQILPNPKHHGLNFKVKGNTVFFNKILS